MPTFLLTWNPRLWSWEDLDDTIAELRQAGHVADRWSCGRSTRIAAGDRVFLLRQAAQPRGLIGSGWVKRGWFEAEHWGRQQVGSGPSTTHFVDVEWDVLSREPLINRAELEAPEFAGVHWDTQMSGITIPDAAAERLEQRWRPAAAGAGFGAAAEDGRIYEGTRRLVRTSAPERSALARSLCIAYYGSACVVCGFSFGAAYGPHGEGYIEVHHLKPLADQHAPHTVDPVTDLRPLCPNCHAMAHRRRPPFTPDALRAMLADHYSPEHEPLRQGGGKGPAGGGARQRQRQQLTTIRPRMMIGPSTTGTCGGRTP